ncbi:MAG: methylated-DNA--[protein]-cysteine S-methyltransferase, partial [Calditrichales bacterium]|nr:methylated-DNA--[protein]-cysteine S-methyltransferase [Calditrichales bacterium]
NKISCEIEDIGIITICANLQDSAIVYIHFGEMAEGVFKKTTLLKNAENQIRLYFLDKLKEFQLPLYYSGTKFQNKVWETLKNIPYGKVISYKQLAEKSGYKNAYRAVGSANNKNPLPIIIPCHRVVNHNGEPGGFASGLSVKKRLLNLERIKFERNRIHRDFFIR